MDRTGAYSGKDMILKNRQASEHGNLIGRQEKLDRISIEMEELLSQEIELTEQSRILMDTIHSSQFFLKEQLRGIETLRQVSSQ